ncbi:MAG TPA: diadenylate cyclase CdaA [Bacillota bacterium]|nr:diadenylate cyclase CdaA [Bacillota bacterium]HOK68112.1 diadenylate cyclase CdaA [Bacillota bacterium]HPP84414.1 diadenylate cyclase CdaA [Bacillota bacterium]
MNNLLEKLTEYIEYIKTLTRTIKPIDVVDIIIVAFILYYTMKFVRDRRAGKLLMGIVFLIILLVLSDLLQMRALNFILTNVFSVGLIALIIVFQPELRSALEKMGGESLKGFKGKLDRDEEAILRSCISEICVAAESLSNSKTGALIVFERGTKLGDVIRTGTIIDAQTSSFLVSNIFYDKAPLHDGAVIIRGGRVYAAGCFLPLSTNNDIVKELGTRHRAGIGMSENSDAVVLIISEETGIISVAVDGDLKRGFSRKTLEEKLTNLLITEETNAIADKVKSRFGHKKNNKK